MMCLNIVFIYEFYYQYIMSQFPWSFLGFGVGSGYQDIDKKIVKSTKKPSYLQEPSYGTPVSMDGFFKIVIILDESLSMNPIRNDIINSINDLIKEQKSIKERPTTFTLVKFNHNVNRFMINNPLSEVSPLTSLSYKPNGGTALYDAIGDTIHWFRNEKNVLMIIVTDGEENASKRYNKQQINQMIDERKVKSNWSYVYLSSDPITEVQGTQLGLDKSVYSANCQTRQNNFGKFISKDLNIAITNCRKTGLSVQEQINTL